MEKLPHKDAQNASLNGIAQENAKSKGGNNTKKCVQSYLKSDKKKMKEKQRLKR